MKLAALMGGGLLGLYCLGFLTKRGNGWAVSIGIVATLAFTLFMTVLEWTDMRNALGIGWLNRDYAATLSFVPEWLARMDTYYVGLIGNLLMFVVGYAAGAVLFPARRDLTNLTVWTQSGEPEEAVVAAATGASD